MKNNFQFSIFNFQVNLNARRYTLDARSGFTLVELLVVVAVISVLIVVLFPNFMGVRQRARDSQRKSDLSQLQRVLELYKLDQSPQAYPTTDPSNRFPSSLCSTCFSSSGIGSCSSGNLYIRKFPCDPASANPTPYLYTRNNELQYTMTACLENKADPDRDTTTDPACGSDYASYTVREP